MALRYKTIKLMERIAERLEKWANEWGKRLLKDKPNNARQIREALLASLGNTDFPHLTFKIEFYSSLEEALKGFDYVKKELPVDKQDGLTNSIEKGYKDLKCSLDSVTKLDIGSCEWLRNVNNSRSCAIDLAKDLQHKAELAREELAAEKPAKAKPNATPAKDGKEKTTIINIKQNSKSIFGGVQQVENVQTGDQASIHKQPAKGGLLKIAKRFLDWVLKLWPK